LRSKRKMKNCRCEQVLLILHRRLGRRFRSLPDAQRVQRIPSWLVKPSAIASFRSARRTSFLRLVAEIAPRCQLEIPERAVVALEWGAQFRRRLTGRPSWGGYSFLRDGAKAPVSRGAAAPERRLRKNRRLYRGRK
jgi:hypothetical protein